MSQTENAKNWFFPPLNGGEFQGFSDSSTDNFKTTDNLGRESAQNSIGALRDGCETVSMKYTLKTVDTNLFPGRENYLKRLNAARNFYSSSDKWTGDELRKIDKAIETIKKDKIRVLVISDFNTTGLYGEEDSEIDPYFKFFKSQNLSTYSEMSAGTYGEGKNAFINFSTLRAITVYSKHIQPINGEEDLYVGRSKLCSHIDPSDTKETQKVGYYAVTNPNNDGWSSYRGNEIDYSIVPIKRNEYGTDIYVWGFNDLDDLKFWDIRLAMGLMYAFFKAVRRKKIEFEIFDEDQLLYKFNYKNINEFREIVEKNCIEKLGLEEWEKSDASLVKGYLKCSDYHPSNKKQISLKTKDFGYVDLTIYSDKEDKSLQNKFCIMRKPLMTIQSFSRGESGFPYQAVCEINDDAGNILLSRLEDVTHTDLHVKHVKGSASDKNKCKYALRNLKRAIHEKIDALTPKIKDSTDIPGLAELLWGDPINDFDGNSIGGDNNISDNREEIETLDLILDPQIKQSVPAYKIRKKPSVVIQRTPSSRGDTGGNEGDHGGDGEANNGQGHGAGEGQGNAQENPTGENESLIPTELVQIIRTRSVNDMEVSKFKIKALKKIKGKLRLGFALDEKGKQFIPINQFDLIKSDKSIKDKNLLIFDNVELYKNDSFEFEIKFSSEFNFAVGAY